MIEAKFKVGNEWEYREFSSEEQFSKFLADNEGAFSEYQIKPEEKLNWFIKWWRNLTNTKKNWKKVKASPYATLGLALKFRKLIIGLLIPWLLWKTYKMVVNYKIDGIMGLIGRLAMILIMVYVCWQIYRSIPRAKKEIEYYKKYPHTINYCPTNTKETVNDILEKIKQNKGKKENGK